jgi:hypothetical protein
MQQQSDAPVLKDSNSLAILQRPAAEFSNNTLFPHEIAHLQVKHELPL